MKCVPYEGALFLLHRKFCGISYVKKALRQNIASHILYFVDFTERVRCEWFTSATLICEI